MKEPLSLSVLKAILNGMDTCLYVSDIQTDEYYSLMTK